MDGQRTNVRQRPRGSTEAAAATRRVAYTTTGCRRCPTNDDGATPSPATGRQSSAYRRCRRPSRRASFTFFMHAPTADRCFYFTIYRACCRRRRCCCCYNTPPKVVSVAVTPPPTYTYLFVIRFFFIRNNILIIIIIPALPSPAVLFRYHRVRYSVRSRAVSL